jgi:uncharacterized protein (TIGR01619 family)
MAKGESRMAIYVRFCDQVEGISMSDNWDFYRLRVDDQPASIFVDLGLKDHAPLKNYPMTAYLRIFMRSPREDGLSSQDEFDDLIGIEDMIAIKVVHKETTLYVGRVTSNGYRDFIFYTQSPTRFEIAAKEAMINFPLYQFELGIREDQEWQTYLDFLYPSERDMQLINNRRVCEQLESNGDDITKARQIDHFVLLPNLESCSTFLSSIKSEGFSIGYAPEGSNGHEELLVEFSRIDCPDQINDIVMSLYDRAKALGGDYDGWGCEISP